MTEIITISLPLFLREKIDHERGLISRSKYIVQKLEVIFCENNQKQNSLDKSVSLTKDQQKKKDKSTNT
jgi:hypothetical protein